MTVWALWLPEALRAAGLEVVEHDGWKTRGHGGFTDLRGVVWHHDGSPEGDSPGVPAYMIRNWDKAAAQLWVSRAGVWHVLAAGVAYHAGAVLPGKVGNKTSLGVETDHTDGEAWPAVLLSSLRTGTAAILRRLDRDPRSALEFHRTVCAPVGRKDDPAGLFLASERSAVAAEVARLSARSSSTTTTSTPTPEEDPVPPLSDADTEKVARRARDLVREDLRTILGGDPAAPDIDATHYSLADLGRDLAAVRRLLEARP